MIDDLIQAYYRACYPPPVKAAMRRYRAAHPRCEWDGCSDRVDVHHLVPFHVAPAAGADEGNMMSLSRRCHFTVGHGTDWSRYTVNCRALCAARIGAGTTQAQGGMQ